MSFTSERWVTPTPPTSSAECISQPMEVRIGRKFWIKDQRSAFRISRFVLSILNFYLPEPGTRTVLRGAHTPPSTDLEVACSAPKTRGKAGLNYPATDCPTAIGDAEEWKS